MAGTPTEDMWGWLERTEIPIDDWWDYDQWATYMEEELGLPEATRKESLWDFKEGMVESLSHAGVYPVEYERYGRTEQRWVVMGKRGLFKWDSIKNMFPELYE